MSVPFFVESDKDLVIDYRDDVPGDSYNNAWPFFYNSLENYIGIAVHHSAGPYSQTVDDIAWYHVNSRGWGGIGYHFVVKNGKAYYVGDLGVGRSHVAGLNDKYIGICVIGDYTKIDPSYEDLRAVHLLCKEFIENEPTRFPNVKSWENVKPHEALTSTACPGDIFPDFWSDIVGGPTGSPDNPDSECEKKLEEVRKQRQEWRDKYNSEKEQHSKEMAELEKALNRSKELATSFESSLNDSRRELALSQKELEFVKGETLPELERQNGILRETVTRLQAQKFTIGESLAFLINAIKNNYERTNS